MNTPSRLIPALVGGSIIGVLSTIPVLALGNCFCCMWILVGGAFSAVLYKRSLPDQSLMTAGDGAVQGLIAGIFGALFGTLLGYILMVFTDYRPEQEFLKMFIENSEDVPSEFEDMIDEIKNYEVLSMTSAVLKLIGSLIIDTLFGILGGLLGVGFSKTKKKQAMQHFDEPSF